LGADDLVRARLVGERELDAAGVDLEDADRLVRSVELVADLLGDDAGLGRRQRDLRLARVLEDALGVLGLARIPLHGLHGEQLGDLELGRLGLLDLDRRLDDRFLLLAGPVHREPGLLDQVVGHRAVLLGVRGVLDALEHLLHLLQGDVCRSRPASARS
jgi:hypothetical protein